MEGQTPGFRSEKEGDKGEPRCLAEPWGQSAGSGGVVGQQGGLARAPERTLRGCLTRGEAFHLALAGLAPRRQAEGGHCGRSR